MKIIQMSVGDILLLLIF